MSGMEMVYWFCVMMLGVWSVYDLVTGGINMWQANCFEVLLYALFGFSAFLVWGGLLCAVLVFLALGGVIVSGSAAIYKYRLEKTKKESKNV